MSIKRVSVDWLGDSYPGEDHTEEKTIDKDWTQLQFTEDPKTKVEEHNWIMSGGYVKISDEDFESLMALMGHKDDWKPLAYGTVEAYYNYEMMFHLQKSNIATHLVEKGLKKYCTDHQLKYEGILSSDGTFWEDQAKEASWERTADVPGVGRENPEKLWRMHMIDTQPVDYYGEQDPKIDNEPQGEMICPHCGEICDSYGDFLVHEERAHHDGLGIPDSPQPVVEFDDPMPAHLNTNPDTRTDMTVNRQASWSEDLNWRTYISAKMPLIPAPIPFIFDIESDKIHSGQPGHKHKDIKPKDKLTVNVVEGLYLPDGKLQFRTDSTMPYTVRYVIRMWYTLYPELEVKQVFKLVGDKKFKLANAKNIGGKVRDVAFTDQAAREAYSVLSNYGDLYVVGGAVRDICLGHLPKDIDLVAAGLTPDQISTLLNSLPGQTKIVGEDFPVFEYQAQDGSKVEIALPRTEVSTGEGHKEFDVQADPFLPIETDLARRDFTCNAQAVNMRTGEHIDPFNGQHDLSQHELKEVSPLKHDPLRILRAFALISGQGLKPDEEVKKAIEENAYRLRAVPPQKIYMQLDKIFGGRDPESAIRAMRDLGVLHYVMPEVAATIDFDQKNKNHKKTLDEHSLEVLRKVAEESDDPDLLLSSLYHDVGKIHSQWLDDDGNGHYYKKIHNDKLTGEPTGEESGANHEAVGAQMAHDFMTRNKYPDERRDRVVHLIRNHMFHAFEDMKGARKFVDKVSPEHAHDLLTLRNADQEGKGTADEWGTKVPVSLQRQMVQNVLDNEYDENPGMSQGRRPDQVGLANLAVNGKDLIAEGIPATSEMGRILHKLWEAVMDDPSLNNKAFLLEMARNFHQMRDASVKRSTFQHKDELPFPFHDNPTDEDWKGYHNARHQWENDIKRGLSLGHLTADQAKEYGYYLSGNELDDGYPMTTENGEQVRRGWQPLPQELYHVTTSRSGVLQNGLKSRYELGQDRGRGLGGGDDTSVSFTTNPELAQGIHDAMLEMRRVQRGEFTVPQMLEMAAKGEGANKPWLGEMMRSYGADKDWSPEQGYPRQLDQVLRGMHVPSLSEPNAPTMGTPIEEAAQNGYTPVPGAYTWMGGDGKERAGAYERPATPEEEAESATQAYKYWAPYRARAGGPVDPMFFSSDETGLRDIPEDEIALMKFRPRPGGMGYPTSGMNEWRTHSGEAVEPAEPVDPYQVTSSILDPIRDALDEAVFEHADADMPRLKPKIRHWIKKTIYKVLRDNNYPDPEEWTHLVLTGSLTTYQWSPSSDLDVALFLTHPIPDWRRAELISLLLKHVEDVPVPGTTHRLGIYIEPVERKPSDIFRPGLRSAFDIDNDRWIVLPERERTIDIQKEMGNLLTYAKTVAAKMKTLILYDPPGAKTYWHQIMERWRRDQTAGKGDYHESNIVYKYLMKHHLSPFLTRNRKSAIIANDPGSASGRPPVSGTGYGGSNPSPGAMHFEPHPEGGYIAHGWYGGWRPADNPTFKADDEELHIGSREQALNRLKSIETGDYSDESPVDRYGLGQQAHVWPVSVRVTDPQGSPEEPLSDMDDTYGDELPARSRPGYAHIYNNAVEGPGLSLATWVGPHVTVGEPERADLRNYEPTNRLAKWEAA